MISGHRLVSSAGLSAVVKAGRLDLCLLSGHIFKNQFLLQSSRALEVSRNFHRIHQFSSIQNFPFGTEEKHMSGLWDLCLNVNKCISYRSKLKQYKIKLNVKLLFCSTCQRDDVHQWHVTILRKVMNRWHPWSWNVKFRVQNVQSLCGYMSLLNLACTNHMSIAKNIFILVQLYCRPIV